MKPLLRTWMLISVAALTISAQAQIVTDSSFTNFYTINDTTLTTDSGQFQSPLTLIKALQPLAKGQNLNLLQWIDHEQSLEEPVEKYNRLKHFGTWIRPSTDCQNTRAKVLIRDSKTPVNFTTPDHCAVSSGSWEDPYSNQVFTNAKDIQIDHVVPLKHAYDAGAWKWDNKKRCMYANFISNDFHLLSVSGHENQSKGSKAPDEYLPPNNTFVCNYIKDWLKIKIIWNLALVPPEADGITNALKEHNCSEADMNITKDDLDKQRSQLDVLRKSCEISAIYPAPTIE